MKLFIAILSWVSIVAGISLFIFVFSVFFSGVPINMTDLAGLVSWLLFSTALFLSGLLFLKRKTWGRYLFSACLIFLAFVSVVVLKFFSEPLDLNASHQPTPGHVSISWAERGRILLESFPDNYASILQFFALLCGCIVLFFLIHSPQFKSNFKK